MADLVYAHDLSIADRLVLKRLEDDNVRHKSGRSGEDDEDCNMEIASGSGSSALDSGSESSASTVFSEPIRRRTTKTAVPPSSSVTSSEDEFEIAAIKAMGDPKNEAFEPTVIVSRDLRDIKLSPVLDRYLLRPYVQWAQGVARRPTDAVFVTHLLLYTCTILPSAIYLFRNFNYLHGIVHTAMAFYYMGTYTLMMHQHIHQRGVLAPQYSLFDKTFPYITDTLMGHTWNSYYFHHVKHHHIEGNGPNDLSSTLRYQRDSALDFICYFLRFMLFVWAELPLYFFSKKRPGMALKTLTCELSNYAFYFLMAKYVDLRATIFVFLLPLMLMRLGMMVGNWGQHALVHPSEPDSDYRSSITLIDVPSNRYCFNDGYHTSHHLNPLRHWRDHPAAFLEQRHKYAKEGALVFHNIDYLMLTVRLLMKDYETLAKCLVPIGDQIDMTMKEREDMLRNHTTKFTEEQIKRTFTKASS